MIQEIINAIERLVQGNVDPVAALTKRAAEKGQASNWNVSIVDLLKLVDMDSSLAARKQLATELGYTGADEDGSAAKNIWLHKAVMKKIAERGIKVPT